MDYIRLADGLPPSSRLGFGCGSVMGRVGRGESLRAIAAALDAGITHFDVARVYGYGEAEAVLGEALRGRRDRVIIASKFGLVRTRTASVLRGLKPLAQRLVAGIPALRPLIRSVVGTAHAVVLSPAAVEASLHESLRALKTDYIDILFVHDGGPAELSDEVVAFLDGQVQAGTIRTYGAATGIDSVLDLIAGRGDGLFYQFANSVCVRNADRLPPLAQKAIAHSPFAGAERVRQLLQAYPAHFRVADGRPIPASDIHQLMLAYALSVEPIGVVLCSMLKGEHLAGNIAAVERPAYSAQDVAAFAAAVSADNG